MFLSDGTSKNKQEVIGDKARTARITSNYSVGERIKMSPGDPLKTSKPIRSQKTGVVLPREGTFVRMVENMGRQLILVNFGAAGYEYIFPDEIIPETASS